MGSQKSTLSSFVDLEQLLATFNFFPSAFFCFANNPFPAIPSSTSFGTAKRVGQRGEKNLISGSNFSTFCIRGGHWSAKKDFFSCPD